MTPGHAGVVSSIEMRQLTALCVLGAAALAASGCGGSRHASESSRAGIFRTVPASKLAAGGVTLTAPRGPVPSADAGRAAARAASRRFGGRKVLEYHYVHCVDRQSAGALDEDCWAVSLAPAGLSSTGPPGSAHRKASYLIAFVDPAGDRFIEAQSGA